MTEVKFVGPECEPEVEIQNGVFIDERNRLWVIQLVMDWAVVVDDQGYVLHSTPRTAFQQHTMRKATKVSYE